MRIVVVRLTLLLLIAALGFLLYETWALAELAGRREIAAREARAALAQVSAELQREHAGRAAGSVEVETAAAATVAESAAEIARLERELALATAQLGAMAEAVREVKERAEQRVAAAREAERQALAAMPEGVRQCLAALHTCLSAEGYAGVRFLRARSLDEEGLHGVEAMQVHPDGLSADLIVAGTMKAALDRSTQQLAFTFFDGTRTAFGERVELPEAGWSILFRPVDGRLIEQRLPYLVAVDGVYPRDREVKAEVRPSDVDFATRLAWLERFDQLLEAAGTTEQIRVERFRGIAGGEFLDAQLFATDAKGHVGFGASCARLSVEVDRGAGVVSLVLREGLLRRGEAESTITAEGYRMLLPKVKPERAVELMLGLVVHK